MPRTRPTIELAHQLVETKRLAAGRLGGRESDNGHDMHIRGNVRLHDPDWCRACLLRDLNNEEVTHADNPAES